jgi:uncharacterized phage protein (TIGR01671 family)
MNREIQFKVWCHDKKEWEKDECVMSQNGNIYHLRNDRVLRIRTDMHKAVFYTGLHDRNGKCIYEGDILKCYTKSNPSLSQDTFVVRFSIDAYKNGFVACTLPHELSYIELWYDEIEVIGNIFENPELLK